MQLRVKSSALATLEDSECSKCLVESEPLSVYHFNILDEWFKSAPIHVQLLLESFINKDYVRRSEQKDIYLRDKIRSTAVGKE